MNHQEMDADQGGLKAILFNIIQGKLADPNDHGHLVGILREMMDFGQELVQDLEISGQAPKVSCGKGCSYCCHSRVNILPIEALLISGFMDKEFDLTAVEAIKAKIQTNLGLTRGKSFFERVALKEQTPCIFLENCQCRVYEVRPMICRAWNSLDKKGCQAAFANGNADAQIDSSKVRNYVFSTTRDLFGELSCQMGLQADLRQIPEAIGDCLASSSPLVLWGGGGELFKPQFQV
ncbi:MAG: YkgJ family cysteine cluster protein [Desulfobacter sp.]|nr:YkgJ family cysteine cluster protein [Desulfobacter sp.]